MNTPRDPAPADPLEPLLSRLSVGTKYLREPAPPPEDLRRMAAAALRLDRPLQLAVEALERLREGTCHRALQLELDLDLRARAQLLQQLDEQQQRALRGLFEEVVQARNAITFDIEVTLLPTDAERKRLTTEREKLAKDVEGTMRKLTNPDFLARAPEHECQVGQEACQ